MMKIEKMNKACAYYPCHKILEDCTFCYCPFYPCLDKSLGKYVYSEKSKNGVWSCQECNWIHRKKVVEEILGLVRVKGHKYFRGLIK